MCVVVAGATVAVGISTSPEPQVFHMRACLCVWYGVMSRAVVLVCCTYKFEVVCYRPGSDKEETKDNMC